MIADCKWLWELERTHKIHEMASADHIIEKENEEAIEMRKLLCKALQTNTVSNSIKIRENSLLPVTIGACRIIL